MDLIRSIIVFNGGSAGDFLKSVCVEQLSSNSIHTLNHDGMINFDHHYFKHTTGCDNVILCQLDRSKIHQVENTHYYHEFYRSLASNVYYIDYPEKLQSVILESYFKKRCNNDHAKLYQDHLPLISTALQHLITTENIKKALNILWIRNIRSWRKIPSITKINFEEILVYDTLITIVEKIIQQPLPSPQRLKMSYQQWIDKNSDLIGLD